jgi:hypothetical protein
MSWSWSKLVRAHDGDEEQALLALPRMAWVGEYEDDVHQRSRSQAPLAVPVVLDTSALGTPCGSGHPRLVRNGIRHGRQVYICRECRP